VPLLHFNGHAARLRGDLEVSARRRHGHCAVAARLVLSGLRLAARRRRRRSHVHRADRAGRGQLSRPWVLIAWVLLLVGYGTKMGLAPMHTWKPDAYGEAPSIVGAMLAGGVTRRWRSPRCCACAQVVGAAGVGARWPTGRCWRSACSRCWWRRLFLLGTRDFKRMLAYSSVEHMGILSVGAALGGVGWGGAVPCVEQQHDQRRAVSQRGQPAARGRFAARWTKCAACRCSRPRSAADFRGRDVRGHGLPPFGPFFSELQDPAHRFRARARRGGRPVFSAACCWRSSG
jgi:hypothetical protein